MSASDKKKSEFETACDELKEASNEEEQKDYEIIRNTVESWPKHENPNKDCKCAKTIIKPYHCSSTIKEKLDNFIPNDCGLRYCCFSKGPTCCPDFHLDSYQFISSSSLVALFAIAVNSNQKEATSLLAHVIGKNQYDFQAKVQCRSNVQDFWIKIIGGKYTAFVKGTGTSQRTDCMTYAPVIATKLNNDGLIVLKATKGLLCEGFCNLIADPRNKSQKKASINGNAMIWLREDNIGYIDVEFYGKNGITANDFNISFISDNLKKKQYDNPLLIYPQIIESHEEPMDQSEVSTNECPQINNMNTNMGMSVMMHRLSQQHPQLFASLQQNPQGLQQLFMGMISILSQQTQQQNAIRSVTSNRSGYYNGSDYNYNMNNTVQPEMYNANAQNTVYSAVNTLPPLPPKLRLPTLTVPQMSNNAQQYQHDRQHNVRIGYRYSESDDQSFFGGYMNVMHYNGIHQGTNVVYRNRYTPMSDSRSTISPSVNTIDNRSNN